MSMEITVRELKDVDVVAVSGRVDSSTAPRLDQTLKGLVDNRRYRIVLDLAQVEYMSSAGLRAMVSCLRSVQKRFGNVHVAQPSDKVKEVLDLAGLDVVFDVFEDQVGAVGAF